MLLLLLSSLTQPVEVPVLRLLAPREFLGILPRNAQVVRDVGVWFVSIVREAKCLLPDPVHVNFDPDVFTAWNRLAFELRCQVLGFPLWRSCALADVLVQ